jgi:hypothetical protein
MKRLNLGRGCLTATVVLTLCFASAALCGPTGSTMTLTSGGNFILGDVYVGPYTATIDGVSTQVVCDDYEDNTYLNETWKATTSTLPSPSGTLWDSRGASSNQYNEVAWLTEQLFAQASKPGATDSSVGDVQYALWAVFDPSALNDLSGNDLNSANTWLKDAGAYGSTSFSGFTIYTPEAGTDTCGNGPCPTNPPQEFVVMTPEPSQAGLLAADLSLFAIAVLALRRRGWLAVRR